MLIKIMLLSLLATVVAADNSHRSRKRPGPRRRGPEERTRGYKLVYEKGYCGSIGKDLGRNIRDPQECYQLAKHTGASAFSMGRKYRKGRCSVELLKFPCSEYKQWLVRAPQHACI